MAGPAGRSCLQGGVTLSSLSNDALATIASDSSSFILILFFFIFNLSLPPFNLFNLPNFPLFQSSIPCFRRHFPPTTTFHHQKLLLHHRQAFLGPQKHPLEGWVRFQASGSPQVVLETWHWYRRLCNPLAGRSPGRFCNFASPGIFVLIRRNSSN